MAVSSMQIRGLLELTVLEVLTNSDSESLASFQNRFCQDQDLKTLGSYLVSTNS
jgi:hypothetical protein